LKHLRDLKKLRSLDLGGTDITDAGLVHLRDLTALIHLNLSNTAVTDAGIDELQKALQKLRISR